MNVLLIQPPIRDFYHTGHRIYPLGLLYLASALKDAGFSCQVLDAASARKKKALPIPPALSYLREYYSEDDKSPFRLFGRFYHFGLLEDEISQRLKAADLVGISSLFTPYEEEALAVARLAKRMGKTTVVGGGHATVAALHIMNDPAVDYVILGEGEERLVALAEAICGRRSFESIDGLAWRTKEVVRINPPKAPRDDLDALSFPDRSLLDPDLYSFQGKRYTMMLSSRGCPYRCRFCSSRTISGRSSVRLRSVENILAEMRICFDRYRIRVFDFEDEHFTWQRERTIKLLEAIEAEFRHDQDFGLLFENGLFSPSLDRQILSRLKKLGCHHLNLPLVSSSDKTLHRLGRPQSSASFARTVSEATECGFFTTGYLILGLPGSSLEEMVDSIRFLAAQPVLVAPSIFYATPGMDLYDECQKNGWLPPQEVGFSVLRSSALAIETERFKRLDLVTLFRLVRAINFIKSLIDEMEDEMIYDEATCEMAAISKAAGEGKSGSNRGGGEGKREVRKADEGEGRLGQPLGASSVWEISLSEFLARLIGEFYSRVLAEEAASGQGEEAAGGSFLLLGGEPALSCSHPLSPRELGLWLLDRWLHDARPAFFRIQMERPRRDRAGYDHTQAKSLSHGRQALAKAEQAKAEEASCGLWPKASSEASSERRRFIYRMVRQADSERVFRIFLELMDRSAIRGIKNPSLSLIWDLGAYP